MDDARLLVRKFNRIPLKKAEKPGAIETETIAISLLPLGPSPTRSALEESLAKYEAALEPADTQTAPQDTSEGGANQ